MTDLCAKDIERCAAMPITNEMLGNMVRQLIAEQPLTPETVNGKSFANAIRTMLSAKGWRVKDLAERLGVSASCVSRWMTGQITPHQRTIDRLAPYIAEYIK